MTTYKWGVKRRKPTTLSIGTISEGTLRPEDLIPAYLSALDGLRLTKAERATVREIRRKELGDGTPTNDSQMGDSDELGYDVDELTQILESHVPDYCYFGTTEGDGACFGVWVDHDSVASEVQSYGHRGLYSTQEEVLQAHPDSSHVMEVNDHGNATLYRRAGNRWIEVWSVV